MFFIILESTDPFFNLAIEEILFKNNKEEYLILGINSQSVIIGKHQTAHREVNTRFTNDNNIPVIRRISGGGAVFHDKGNLNFTFIRQSEAGRQVDFHKYTLPVIEFLASAGVEAKFEGKNDIKVNGLKISGNAEHVSRNRVLHHGTLLFNTSLDILRTTLQNNSSKYSTKAVESNPSSVTNLKEILNKFQDINEFRSEMVKYFLNKIPDITVYKLTESEVQEAEVLAISKYKTWEWNFAYGPEYIFKSSFKIDGKIHSCCLLVIDGVIVECSIGGSDQMISASKKLLGCRHMVQDMLKVFREEKILITDEEIYYFF